MNHEQFSAPLPQDAARYLAAVRRLDAPTELVDNIMAEVEATPQVRPTPTVQAVSGLLLVAAAVLLAIAILLRIGTPTVGPSPTPVPLDELPSAGTVQARISVETDDVPAAFGHGFLWLTNGATGELVRMDPANGSIASPLLVTQPGRGVPVLLTGSSVFVVDRRDSTLVELDPASLEERRRIPVSVDVSVIASDGIGGLWLLDSEAEVLTRIDEADGTEGGTIAIAGTALLVHAGSVWVADSAGALVQIDPGSGAEVGRIDIGITGEQLLTLGDSIIAVARGESIVRVRLESMSVESRGLPVLTAAADADRLWVVTPSGLLVRLDASTLQPLAASSMDLDASGTLAFGAGSLWTTGRDPSGDAFLLQYSDDE